MMTYPTISPGYRQIKDGSSYDHLFPKAKDRDTIIKKNGNLDQTIEQIKRLTIRYLDDTKQIAQLLKGTTIKQTCDNIWKFLYNHIQYHKDKDGLEELRRPARSWEERKTGIDCDDFTIFASSILANLRIPHRLRVVKYNNGNFQHIYVVVPVNGNTILSSADDHYTIDAVVSEPDYEKPYTEKKDIKMSLNGIDIALLEGIAEEKDSSGLLKDIIFPEEGTGSFGAITDKQGSDRLYNYLVKTREYLTKNPSAISLYEDPVTFIKLLDYAIKYWNTPQKEEALKILIHNEELLNRQDGFVATNTIQGFLQSYNDYHPDRSWEELDNMSNTGIEQYLNGIEEELDRIEENLDNTDQLGELGKTDREAKRKKRKDLRAEKKTIKETTAKGKESRQAIKKWRKENKRGFFNAVGKGLKELVRYNPLTIAARNGFLLALKLNLFHIAENLKWAYATPEQAKGKTDPVKRQRAIQALQKVEKLYADKLQGKREKLKDAILKGKSGGLSGIPDNYFNRTSQLGIVESAAIAAAIPVVTTVLNILKDSGILIKDVKKEDMEKELTKAYETTPKEDMPDDDQGDASGDAGKKPAKENKFVKFIKENPVTVLGGLAFLAIGGYMILKPKNRNKQSSQQETLEGTTMKRTKKRARTKNRIKKHKDHETDKIKTITLG